MRLVTDESRVVVKVIHAHRDTRQKLENGKPNPSYGKFVYETMDSFDVYEAKPEEVFSVCQKAIETAAKK